jgi:hypothetical protein
MAEKSLQERFAETRGSPIIVDDLEVIQMDRIPVTECFVTIEMLGDQTGRFGVALKSRMGGIELSDGRLVKLLYTWNEPRLPSKVAHRVECPDGELRVWNIYRVNHSTGHVSEDAWTGNAGMIVEQITDNKRLYHCSSGPGSFDPEEFKFELSWE